jgi:tRNA threonylcarbamoyladenosine biosynthesis protein TsaE
MRQMAILDERTLEFVSHSEAQTLRLGVRLGELLQPYDLVRLSGGLGAGKTVLARGIGRGWGAAMRVTSPTFTLVNQYPRMQDGILLYHVDCYRLSSWADAVTAGLEDILDQKAAIMIEWPERIGDLLPDAGLDISLAYESETKRQLRFQAIGERTEALLKAFRQSAFGR